MTDPSRLNDERERALIESLREDAPSDDVRAGMWKAIAAQAIVGGVASSATESVAPVKVGFASKVATAVATKAVIAKVAVVVAVSAVGAGAAFLHQPAVKPVPAVASPAPVADPDEEAARAAARLLEAQCPAGVDQPPCAGLATNCGVTGEAVEVAAPAAKPVQRARHRRVRAEAAPPKAVAVVRPPAPAPLDTLQAESRMLAQARARLRAGDLAGAEQVLNQARDQFAQGALGQEREVLQIELLAKLGDRDGADHRARRFLRKHPDSPHAKTVQRFLTAQ
jgi:hypothetical protein